MFQQNECYIKNNIALTQVMGFSLWSMIVKDMNKYIMWLFNFDHKAMILLYCTYIEKIFSAILLLLL